LAREAADKGRLSEAVGLCEKAIDADKLNASLYYLKATILLETGKADEAAMCLRQAIYIDRDFILAHFALGHLMHQQERNNEAKKHFETACALLMHYGQEEILPESGGISAGRLMEIIKETRGVIS
jgi:chemotaxis protein methyltransferase CheR